MFSCPLNACSRKCWIASAAILTYFILFPEDVESVVAPFRTILSLTQSVSLGFYAVAAVALVCWAFGRRGRSRSPDESAPM
jgi:hypothetical protein